jgi:RNA polymerase sigma-70 factor (ECF subfamily)
MSNRIPEGSHAMPVPSSNSDANETPVSLLDRLRNRGSERDWGRFVELYRRLIGMWLTRAGVSPSDREDLSQDVLAALLKSVPEFQHNGRAGAFRRWLKTLVIHRVLNYCRGRGRHHAVFVSLRDGSESAMNELVIEDRMLTAVWEQEHDDFVIKQLMELVSSDFAQTTWLAFQHQVVEGHSAARVAHELGMSVNAALIAKSRVLKRLREEAAGLVD